MSILASYKPGQARLSRMVTLLAGWFLVAWGCRSLLQAVPQFWPAGGDALNQFGMFGGADDAHAWKANLVVLNEKLSPAFLMAAVLLVVGGIWWWRFLNRERWAEMLIEMEAELRKVSWPTASDAWQSTLVVTGFTFTIVATILVYDMVIKGFIELFVV